MKRLKFPKLKPTSAVQEEEKPVGSTLDRIVNAKEEVRSSSLNGKSLLIRKAGLIKRMFSFSMNLCEMIYYGMGEKELNLNVI